MIDAAQQRILTLEKKVGHDAKSPLFAQLAYFYLEASRAQDALRICDAGLANFPFYTTGHLVKGKALIALNLKSEARREFEFVLDFLPHNEAVLKLLEQIPQSEEETLAPLLITTQPEVIKPEQPPSPVPASSYTIPYTPEIPSYPEQNYSLDKKEPVMPEPQLESPPIAQVPTGTSFFDAITQTPPVTTTTPTTEDPFGFGESAPSVEAPIVPEPLSFNGFESPVSEPTTLSYNETTEPPAFTDFNAPPPPILETPEPTSPFTGFNTTTPVPSSFPELQSPSIEEHRKFTFSLDIDGSIPSAPVEEEPFEKFVTRTKPELSEEDTVSLDDYIKKAPNVSQETAEQFIPKTVHPTIDLSTIAPIQNDIEEIANKLQTAKKITPVIDLTKKEAQPAQEKETTMNMGFVTPTLAEIYAKQGWFDDAIKAYKALAHNKPAEKDRFEKRILELEEMKKKNS